MRKPRARRAEDAIDAALARIDAILARVEPLLAAAERNERRYGELLARYEAAVGIAPARAAGATVH